MQKSSLILQQYAGYLFVVGLASAFYNAADGSVGWNDKGKSGLIACGICAVVVGLLGWLTGKGHKWAAWGGLGFSFLLLCYGGYTAFKTGRAVSDGTEPQHLWYKAAIFAIMAVLSLSTFLRVGLTLRRDPAA